MISSVLLHFNAIKITGKLLASSFWAINGEVDIYWNSKSSFFISVESFLFLCTFNRQIKSNEIEH